MTRRTRRARSRRERYYRIRRQLRDCAARLARWEREGRRRPCHA